MEIPVEVKSSGEGLIFLISQPRAGSTMLQFICGAHPDIHTVSEPWIALHPLFAMRDKGVFADYDADLARTALREFLRRLPEGEDAYWSELQRMLNNLYARALDGSGKRFLDKTPRYYFIIPDLQRIFPRARFIFLLRNPLAVFSSILDTWVNSEDIAHLRPFRHDLLLAPLLLTQGVRSLGPSAIVIHYEKLISAPEAVVRGLCQFLGIEYHPAMIEYGSATDKKGFPFGDQKTVYKEIRPVSERADRWRQVLGRSRVWGSWGRSYLEALGPDLIRDLGYDYSELGRHLRSPVSPGWVERVSEICVELQGELKPLVSLEQAAGIINGLEKSNAALSRELARLRRKSALQTLREFFIRMKTRP